MARFKTLSPFNEEVLKKKSYQRCNYATKRSHKHSFCMKGLAHEEKKCYFEYAFSERVYSLSGSEELR